MNLALAVPEEDRIRSGNLNVGFDPKDRRWELIVKYNGDLETALAGRFPDVDFHGLLGGFAILRVPENEVANVTGLEEIEYAEKPKRLYFAANQARAASCLLPVQTGADGLSGEGILIAVIDSGIDYFHRDFRLEDGGTRILYLYDQARGRVYTQEQINEALRSGSEEEARRLVPSADISGHGTAVAGIAAGNGNESEGLYRGVAGGSELLIVRLGASDPDGFPRTTQIMAGVDFAMRAALELNRPLVVNLSFGNTYGSHDGNGLLERYLDILAEMGRSVFVIGTGNEGDAGGHASGRIGPEGSAVIELSVAPYESGFGVQLWKNYEDEIEIELVSPSRKIREQVDRLRGPYRLSAGSTDILIVYGEPGPFNGAQEIYFDFVPKKDYIESGIWQIVLSRKGEKRGGREAGPHYDLWLPSQSALNRSTRFLRSEPDSTLTVPSTALRPVSVGAYDDSTMTYAPFSGRGGARLNSVQKPDIAAPGVGIITARAGGGYEPVTGTSFAAPFVAGAAALLMEWGLIRGNDPYLYGDKVKAYLRKGAKPLAAFSEYPNPQVGYGVLCLADSLPQ